MAVNGLKGIHLYLRRHYPDQVLSRSAIGNFGCNLSRIASAPRGGTKVVGKKRHFQIFQRIKKTQERRFLGGAVKALTTYETAKKSHRGAASEKKKINLKNQ
jgi:hypothetical protein